MRRGEAPGQGRRRESPGNQSSPHLHRAVQKSPPQGKGNHNSWGETVTTSDGTSSAPEGHLCQDLSKCRHPGTTPWSGHALEALATTGAWREPWLGRRRGGHLGQHQLPVWERREVGWRGGGVGRERRGHRTDGGGLSPVRHLSGACRMPRGKKLHSRGFQRRDKMRN